MVWVFREGLPFLFAVFHSTLFVLEHVFEARAKSRLFLLFVAKMMAFCNLEQD
jgi:hypothetical protein